jgi:hypothetical protein
MDAGKLKEGIVCEAHETLETTLFFDPRSGGKLFKSKRPLPRSWMRETIHREDLVMYWKKHRGYRLFVVSKSGNIVAVEKRDLEKIIPYDGICLKDEQVVLVGKRMKALVQEMVDRPERERIIVSTKIFDRESSSYERTSWYPYIKNNGLFHQR